MTSPLRCSLRFSSLSLLKTETDVKCYFFYLKTSTNTLQCHSDTHILYLLYYCVLHDYILSWYYVRILTWLYLLPLNLLTEVGRYQLKKIASDSQMPPDWRLSSITKLLLLILKTIFAFAWFAIRNMYPSLRTIMSQSLKNVRKKQSWLTG